MYLEERVIELPLSGEVLLTIIRIRDQVTPNMDFLEHSVRTAEEFMSEPLPTNYVAWYFDDSIRATAGGANFRYAYNVQAALRRGERTLVAARAVPYCARGGPLLLA